MKKLVLLLFISAQLLSAQKVVKKTILNKEVSAIEIDATNCFDLNIKSLKTEELLVQATIEGEYEKDLILNIEEEGSNIFINTGFRPNFKNPNDKLSAHKVISIALEIIVPEFQKVQINGTSCNVHATGLYENLKITLNDGACFLKNISKEVTATTQSGDINVESGGARIKTKSKFGNVHKNEIPVGENIFNLNTSTGNIYLSRNQ